MIRWRLDPGQIEVVDDAVAEVLLHKTAAEKLAMVFDANDTMRLMLEAAIARQHPDWSREEVLKHVAGRMLGETG